MKILFAINRDVIQANLIRMLQSEGIVLDYEPERDSVFSKDLIVDKVKYYLNGQEPKYDIAIINEKLDGEYDLIEIIRYLARNNIRPIVLLGSRSDNDPIIHALIKRKVYDFLYGKLKLEDIFRCIVSPTKYEEIEHLVEIDVEEYKIQGKTISDLPFENDLPKGNVYDDDILETIPRGGDFKPPNITKPVNKTPTLNFPGIKDIKDALATKTANVIQNNMPERVVVQQNFVAQLPIDYKKNIAVYSNQQVGKSFVASNLATVLATKGKKTVLVDLDFKNKSQYYYFDMSKYESHVKNAEEMNIIKKVFEYDSDDLSDLISILFSPMKNLYVITSHPDMDIANYDLDDLYRVYVMLRSVFDIVIYDVPGVCDEDYLKLLMTQVEDVIIITNQNCAILDRTEKDLRDVLTGYFVNNKVSLLINQYIDHKEINKGSIKDHLSVIETSSKDIEFNFKNVFTIPNNYFAVVEGIAKGKPAVMFDEGLRAVFENIANKYYPDVTVKRRG